MKIILSGNPISTNQIYRRHGNIIYLSKEGKDRKIQYQWEAKSQWKLSIIEKEIEIDIKLYFKDKRVRDIDNYNKLVLDAMSGIVYKDDKQIKKLTIEKFIDKRSPRVEIFIKI